jgi:hypothetical protein
MQPVLDRRRGRAVRHAADVTPAPPVLVFFVRDAVDDALAEAVVARVRALAGERSWDGAAPGWFDDPDAPGAHVRTTGGYLRVEDLAGDEATAFLGAARAVSAEQDVVIEVQFRERALGRFAGGEPSGALVTLLG